MKILAAFGLYFLWCLSNLILKPKKLSCDELYEREVAKGKFDSNTYQSMKKVQFNLNSKYGYTLSCELLGEDNLKKENSKKNIAILCHGFTCAKCVSLIYARLFLEMNFAVVIYDQRNHGLSGKAHTTMGYYERYDLKKVVDWCYRHYGNDINIVTHGESMGAATVLMHLEIDKRVKCTIADCGYSDLMELLKYQLMSFYRLPQVLLIPVNIITFLRAGFCYQDVSPIRAVRRTNVPILFIHGKNDHYVPTKMSVNMYQAKKSSKELYLVENAGHGENCLVNPEEYKKRLERFLRAYL
ncbi:MAG: alpha/beta hydrolase [Clostridiales bacterium]|nr:alpha/beta hydrolase [Clostridiales bacterium]